MVASHPPIPVDQPCLVALERLSIRLIDTTQTERERHLNNIRRLRVHDLDSGEKQVRNWQGKDA